MPEPDQPAEVPTGIPQEYAEAYRRGYQRAFDESALLAQAAREQAAKDEAAKGAAFADDASGDQVSPDQDTWDDAPQGYEPTTRLDSLHSAFRADPADSAVDWHAPRRDDDRRKYLAPALLAGLVLLLLVSAYGIGKLVSSGVSDVDAADPEPADGVAIGEGGGSGSQGSKPKGDGSGKRADAYDGQVTAAAIGGASVSCQSGSSVDAGGNPVTYEAANMYDGDLTTAWRCNGGGSGQRVQISLPEETAIGEVGMVPGYAKTDARSGADRYAENNRITRVRWHFDDGTTVVQRLDGSAHNRQMQTLRIPETVSAQVVIEILDSVRGPRNTVAISEVSIGATTS
ncbi:MAG: NADase-type glycan-binding domain-containing protein [Nocardioidaceae bacterium]